MQRITPSPQQWVEQLDIRNYAVRQAQSCEYLETYFAGITSHLNFGRQEVGELLEYLLTIHRRQYADISARIPVPHDPHRTSFYFQEMASKHHLTALVSSAIHMEEIQARLVIQAVSYLRGKDRYRLLKEFESEENRIFRPVWGAFFRDAGTNAEKTIAVSILLGLNEDQLHRTLSIEDAVMKDIWRHNHVT